MGREMLLLTAFFEHSVGFRSDVNAILMFDVCFLTKDMKLPFIWEWISHPVCGKTCQFMESPSLLSVPHTRVEQAGVKSMTSSSISAVNTHSASETKM